MSKGGSRYGRRSNWFKINFLLQEQQQKAVAAAQAAVAAAAANSLSSTTSTLIGDRRSALKSSSNFNFLNNSNAGYPPHLSLHPNDRHELKRNDSMSEHMKGKHPLSSSKNVSLDSHNSDSSIEMADRRRLIMKTASQLPFHNDIPPLSQLPFNKDLFMPFSIPDMVSAPSFLPHLLFSGYHSALLAQQQQQQHSSLVKPSIDSALFINPAHFLANNNSRLMPNQNSNNSDNNDNINNNNSYTTEELSKCYFDAVLKTQNSLNLNKKHNMLKSNDEEIDPPHQSPHSNHSSSRNSTPNHLLQPKINSPNLPSSPPPVHLASSPSASRLSSASPSPSNWNNQDTPIDLSVKPPTTIKHCSSNEKPLQSSKLRSFGHENAFQMIIEKT